MEIQGPRPVKAYAYRMAIEEFEMYAERCIEQVLVDHRRQTRTKHPWSARSYIWPLSDTFVLARPERRITAVESPILPFDKFIELYKLNCERILADLEHERICRYLEDLTSILESAPAVHAPTKRPNPMDTSFMPMKSMSTPSRIHRRFIRHTTAEDLLESVLGKSGVLPSETTTSPVCGASDRQITLACAGIKDCKHRSKMQAISTEHTTLCHSYTIAPPEYRRHDHGTSFAQSAGMHRVHSAILLDPAVLEAVPYDTPLVCPSDVAPSIRSPPRSRHGLTKANRHEGVGLMGPREVKAMEHMEVDVPDSNDVMETHAPSHAPCYVSLSPFDIQKAHTPSAFRSPTRTDLKAGFNVKEIRKVHQSEIRMPAQKNIGRHAPYYTRDVSPCDLKKTRNTQKARRKAMKVPAKNRSKSRGTKESQVGPYESRLVQYEERISKKPGLETRYYRYAQFQCSPRPEDLPLPQFSLAKMKAVSKTSLSSGSDTSAP